MDKCSAGSRFLGAALTLLAGSTTFTTGRIAPELKSHVEAVRTIMAREGVALDRSIDFDVADSLHKDSVVGTARARGMFNRIITIKRSALHTYSDAGLEVLLLHEIGHAQFDFHHDETNAVPHPASTCDAPTHAMRIMHARICYSLISDRDSISEQVNELLSRMRYKQNL